MVNFKTFWLKIKPTIFVSICTILMFQFLYQSKKYLESVSFNYLSEMAIKNSLNIETGLDYILNRLSKSVFLVEFDERIINEKGEFNYNKMLLDLQKTSVREHFDALRVTIIDKYGNAITSDGLNKNLSYRDFFKKSLAGELNVSTVMPDIWSGNEIVVFSSPIYYSGDIIGVATMALEANSVSRLIGLDNGTSNNFSFIKQYDGRVLVSPLIHVSNENLSTMLKTREVTSNEVERDGKTYFFIPKNIKFNNWEVVTVVYDFFGVSMIKHFYAFGAVIILMTIFISGYLFVSSARKRKENCLNNITKVMRFDSSVETFMPNFSGYVISFSLKNYDYLKISRPNDNLDDLFIKLVNLVKIVCLDSVRVYHNDNDDFMMFANFSDDQILLDRLESINAMFSNGDSSLSLFFGIYKIINKNESLDDMVRKSIFVRDIYKFKSSGYFYKIYANEEFSRFMKISKIESSIARAFDKNEFEFFLQPKICLKTNLVVGAEALVRWFYNGKYVSPIDFIPILEQNGNIGKLDFYIFDRVCCYLSSMIKFKPEMVLPISVNLSRYNIFEPRLFDFIKSCLKKHSIPPELIEFEITETAFEQVKDYDAISDVIYKLKNIGVKVSLDDFGEGYSSLKFFSTLHFDTIKFDRGFFKDLKPRDIKVISSFVDTAHELGMMVVAEGVESEAQLRIVKNINFDFVQGYFYSKPLSIEDYFNFLKKYNLNKAVSLKL